MMQLSLSEATMPTPPPTIETSPSGSDLASKTVLLRVRFGLLGNSRKISNSVISADADKKLLRASKQLLDSPELKAIKSLDGEMRQYIYSRCLPGFDEGLYFLPIPLVEEVETSLRTFRAKRDQLIDVFMLAYPELCKKAQEALREVWNPRDYPEGDEVRGKFTFSWQYLEFGIPGRLRAISKALFDSEKEKAANVMRDAAEQVQQVMRATLAEMVEHLRERLTPETDGKPKIFRDSAVKNLQEFLASFDFRNVTDDIALKAEVDKARQLIGGADPQALRDFDGLRVAVREGMAEISANLGGLVTARPVRKFREE